MQAVWNIPMGHIRKFSATYFRQPKVEAKLFFFEDNSLIKNF